MANDKLIVRKVLRFLVMKAQNRQTVTYEDLAIKHNLPSSGNALGGALAPILYEIYKWCDERHLPPLSALVVRKSGPAEGLPGRGFWSLISPLITLEEKKILAHDMQRRCFAYFAI